jgi:hypothetical protein
MSWEVILGGVVGAAVAGGIGTYTATRIDRLSAQRDRRGRQDQERAVARLISSELRSGYEAAEAALAKGQWPLWWQPLRSDAWDRHGHMLASRVAQDVFDQLSRTYGQLGDWQNRVSQYLAQFSAASSMNLGGDLPEERESAEILSLLRPELEASYRELQPIAFPDGRDIEPDPDQAPTARQRLAYRWRRWLR